MLRRRQAVYCASPPAATRRRPSDKILPNVGVADAHRVLQHRRKHWLKIAGRAADNLEHLRRSRLLLQRFREVSGALAEVVGALTQFVEQPRVLDGDDGLGGEVRDQLDLLVGEGSHLLAARCRIAPTSSLSFSIGTSITVRVPAQLDRCNGYWFAFGVRLCRCDVGDVDDVSLSRIMRANGIFGPG